MWFLCMRTYLRGPESRQASLDEHFAWMREQHAAGTVVISGPSADRRMGIYLIRAASREDAERVASADPFTAAGDSTYELVEWEIHQILGAGRFSTAEFEAAR